MDSPEFAAAPPSPAAPSASVDSKLALTFGKALMRAFSPGGNAGLSIFIYHRVLARKDTLFPAEIDSTDFDRDLSRIGALFNVIPLLDAVRHRAAGTLPARAACITFDDGYADNAEVALPILQRHQLHATFFVASGFLDGGHMWNDSVIEVVRRAPNGILDFSGLALGVHPINTINQRRVAITALIGQLKYLPLERRRELVLRMVESTQTSLPNDLMMRSDQVLQLHQAGMGIGGHTVSHPILSCVEDDVARAEIAEGKLALETIIADRVQLFAYPNGKPGADYRAEHVRMVRELGFEGAVSTAHGSCRRATDLFQLPRFSPWDRTPLRFAARMAHNLSLPAKCA